MKASSDNPIWATDDPLEDGRVVKVLELEDGEKRETPVEIERVYKDDCSGATIIVARPAGEG